MVRQGFRKGYTPWNKGKKLSKEIRENMSKAFKGRVTSEEPYVLIVIVRQTHIEKS